MQVIFLSKVRGLFSNCLQELPPPYLWRRRSVDLLTRKLVHPRSQNSTLKEAKMKMNVTTTRKSIAVLLLNE